MLGKLSLQLIEISFAAIKEYPSLDFLPLNLQCIFDRSEQGDGDGDGDGDDKKGDDSANNDDASTSLLTSNRKSYSQVVSIKKVVCYRVLVLYILLFRRERITCFYTEPSSL